MTAAGTGATPVASVILAYYNGAATIKGQLEALAHQVDAPPFEVLIMDNNSTDDLSGAVSPYLSGDVRIIPARARQGQCYARNLGALLARGEHLLFCDQDDAVGERWVAALSGALSERPALATGPMDFARLNDPAVWAVHAGDATTPPVLRPFPVQGYLPFVYGCNLGMRREDFISLGGFDNSYHGGDEDTDISWRAQEAGLPLVVEDDAVVHYRLRSEPRELFRQRRGYARTRVLTVVRSLGHRPISGMSLKWTLLQLARSPWEWLRTRSSRAGRFDWALRTGALVGNLEGQLRYRLGHVPEPEMLDRALAESNRGTTSDVVVAIAYFRNSATLVDQLDALAAQKGAPAFRVVIGDNEGSGELRAIAGRYSGRLDIEIVPATDRRGQCHARNTAATASGGEILLFCDADDMVGPEWVRALSSEVRDHDVLATGPLRVHEINPEIAWRTYLAGGGDIESVRAEALRPYAYLGYLPYAIGCSLGIRRSTFCRLGMFDESMLGGCEDVDLSWRAQERGLEIVCVDDAVVDYRLRHRPIDVFRQQRRYERAKVFFWDRSRRMGRPVRGMSLRWALRETARLAPQWWRLRKATEEQRYVAAFRSGSITSNLTSQISARVLRRTR